MVTSLQRFSRRIRPWNVLLAGLTIAGAIVILFPIVWMVFASIRPTSETLSSPPVWVPQEITFDAYKNLLGDSGKLSISSTAT